MPKGPSSKMVVHSELNNESPPPNMLERSNQKIKLPAIIRKRPLKKKCLIEKYFAYRNWRGFHLLLWIISLSAQVMPKDGRSSLIGPFKKLFCGWGAESDQSQWGVSFFSCAIFLHLNCSPETPGWEAYRCYMDPGLFSLARSFFCLHFVFVVKLQSIFGHPIGLYR